MERYSHLQALPNSPLSPLTPLNENTKFEFNFGGDGSLDVYINSVRQEHRVEQQQKMLLQQANEALQKKFSAIRPNCYSEKFLKIRDVFEPHERVEETQQQRKQNNCQHKQQQQQLDVDIRVNKAPIPQIIYTGAISTPTSSIQILSIDKGKKPKNIRVPLKPRCHNVPQNLNLKFVNAQKEQNKQNLQKNNRIFRQASPVAAKALCPQVANILKSRGLSLYCGLFQREEIDLYTFHLLQLQDLQQMGIINPKHWAILLNEIFYAGQYFQNFNLNV